MTEFRMAVTLLVFLAVCTVCVYSDNSTLNTNETVSNHLDLLSTMPILMEPENPKIPRTISNMTITTTMKSKLEIQNNHAFQNTTPSQRDLDFPITLRMYAQRTGCSLSYTTTSRLLPKTLYGHDEVLYFLKCTIGYGRRWFLDHFRNLVNNLPTSSYFVALKLECNYVGGVSLPWPMRAKYLRFLSVDKCNIYNYTREYFNESINSIPDTLAYLRLMDPAIHMTIEDLIRILRYSNTNMTRASTCGPEHAYAWVLQNMTYVFPKRPTRKPNLTEIHNVKKDAKTYFKDLLKERKFSCDYKNLNVFDRSRSIRMGAKQIAKMIQDGKYPELKVFNMSGTVLLRIPEKLQDWRLHFPRMQILDLRHNNISDFNAIVDHGRAEEENSTGVVDLRYNNITLISYRALRTLRHHTFVKVDVRNNPYNCMCEMREFVNYLNKPHNNLTKDANVTNYKYLYLKDLRCANPPSVRGRRIVSLSDEELGCEVEIATIEQGPIIALSFMLVVLIVVVVLFIRYREELTILAFTRLDILLPCHSADNTEDKQYDAFVAYSQHDARWVVNVLRPRLEKPNNGAPFRLCLHHRDFEVGAAISDNIIGSVKHSRHTILVLSRQFLQSEWCLMEFRTAFHQSLLERKKHLIIVLLEKIPEAEIDLDLKRCLKTLTYVEADDNLFWDKLIYALSSKKRNKRARNKNVIHMNERDAEEVNNHM